MYKDIVFKIYNLNLVYIKLKFILNLLFDNVNREKIRMKIFVDIFI